MITGPNTVNTRHIKNVIISPLKRANNADSKPPIIVNPAKAQKTYLIISPAIIRLKFKKSFNFPVLSKIVCTTYCRNGE